MSKNVRFWGYSMHASVAVAFLTSIVLTQYSSCEAAEGLPGDGYCGPRCVEFVLEYHGVNARLDRLVPEMMPEQRKGASLNDIAKAVRSRGLYANAVSYETVDELAPLSIVHLNSSTGHFVVLIGVSDCFVEVWDGLRGVRKINKESFTESQTGNAVWVSGTPLSEATPSGNDAIELATVVAGTGLMLLSWCLRLRRQARAEVRRNGVYGFQVFGRMI